MKILAHNRNSVFKANQSQLALPNISTVRTGSALALKRNMSQRTINNAPTNQSIVDANTRNPLLAGDNASSLSQGSPEFKTSINDYLNPITELR